MHSIIVLCANGSVPVYATEGSAGADLFADTDVIIESGNWSTIPTGIKIEMEKGMEAQIRPRSGLAANYGITVLNSPGTIDSDYRGEIKVILINHSKNDFKVSRGMKIAQIVFSPCVQVNFIQRQELKETQRGNGGFGSTGLF